MSSTFQDDFLAGIAGALGLSFDEVSGAYVNRMPVRRDDGPRQAAWKAAPLPAADMPYLVWNDGVVDLHPSQWSAR